METWLKEVRERLRKLPTAELAHLYEEVPRPVFTVTGSMRLPGAMDRVRQHPELEEVIVEEIERVLQDRRRHSARGPCPKCGQDADLTIYDRGRSVRAVHTISERGPFGGAITAAHCYAGPLPVPDEYQGNGGPYEHLLEGAVQRGWRRWSPRF